MITKNDEAPALGGRGPRANALLERSATGEIVGPKRRGRPPKPDAEVKREQMSFRVTPEKREQIVAAADAAGRSIAQEVELRLEQSFAREDDAGSRAAAILADYVKLAAKIIEGQSGKAWTEDAATFHRLWHAVTAFMNHNMPEPSASHRVVEAAVAAIKATKPKDGEEPSAAHLEARRDYDAADSDMRDEHNAHLKIGNSVAEGFGSLFDLRPKRNHV